MLIAEQCGGGQEIVRSQDLRDRRRASTCCRRRGRVCTRPASPRTSAPSAWSASSRAEDDTYRVKRALREAITFAPQNLLQDPPFSRLDLISCRNLLIYLEPEIQKKLLGLFHFALREGGHLFLGPAETVAGQEDLFQPVSKKWRIYRRLGPTRHDIVDFPLIGRPIAVPRRHGAHRPPCGPRARRRRSWSSALCWSATRRQRADRPHFNVHYFHGPTGDYLRQPGGEPTDQSAGAGARGPAGAVARCGAKGDR